MEKNVGFAAAQPSAPLPMAPPSYEEAIANAGGAPTHPPVVPTTYPLGNAPVQMPMPYHQPPNQTTIPTPSVYPGSSHSTSQPRFNPELNSVPQTEVRVMQHHTVYAIGPNAVKMTCPTCRADIKTTTISDHQPSAHICCIVLCLLGNIYRLQGNICKMLPLLMPAILHERFYERSSLLSKLQKLHRHVERLILQLRTQVPTLPRIETLYNSIKNSIFFVYHTLKTTEKKDYRKHF
ncbi:uncharacterized protein [Temnothorax nylanderi]|uniref:uncharacterized protein isoform X2 n=1 Tax=Temnothorax nylanderi TaxID=102681 RepID=UPI003A844C32